MGIGRRSAGRYGRALSPKCQGVPWINGIKCIGKLDEPTSRYGRHMSQLQRAELERCRLGLPADEPVVGSICEATEVAATDGKLCHQGGVCNPVPCGSPITSVDGRSPYTHGLSRADLVRISDNLREINGPDPGPPRV